MSLINQLLNVFGKNNECPVCGYVGAFLPFGEPPRPKAQCPSCYSLERMRMLWHFLKFQRSITSDKLKLLHIAPDKGLYKKLNELNNIDYVAGDYFAKGYAYEKGVIHLDITDLKFENSSFDAVVCVHVLEHIVDDVKAMKEVYRVLKPGGWAILQVPLNDKAEATYENWNITEPEDRKKHFGQWDHVRVYGLDYKNRLEKAGFFVEVIDYVSGSGSQVAKKYSFPTKDDIYLCHKK